MIVRVGVIVVVMMGIMGMIVMMMIVAELLRVRSFDGTALHQDAESSSHEAATGGLAAFYRYSWEAQTGHRFREHLERHSQVQAGAEKHVAGDAAAAVQVVDRHGGLGYHAPFSRRSLSEAQRPWLPRTT